MTVRSIVCVFFKCYDNYRHVTVFYCHGIIRIKQELLQEVIMKKRIVQLQIGAAAIAAIRNGKRYKCISVFRRFGHCLRKRAEYRGKCNRSQ